MKVRETAVFSGGLLVQQISVFVTGIIIARYLGAQSYGILGVLKSLSSILLIVTPLGLDLALLKHASFYLDRPSELRTTARTLRLVVAGVNLLLLGAMLLWLGPLLADIYSDIDDFSMLCAINMLGLVFAADIQVSGALFRVRDRVVTYSLVVNYSQPALRLLVSLVVILLNGGVRGLVWVNTAMFIYAFLVIALLDRPHGAAVAPAAHRSDVRKTLGILSESSWMAISLLTYQSIRLVDVLILAALTTPAIAGVYAAMSSVAQLIQIYPNALSQTLGPRIALAYKRGDTAEIDGALKSYLHQAALLGGYLSAGIAVYGTDLDLVFGHGFDFPWLLPVLLASGWYISAVLAPFGYVLSMTGRHRQEVAILFGGVLFFVICLLLLVPPFQAIGAALAVALAFVMVNGLRCAYVINVIGRNPLGARDLIYPLIFLAAAGLSREVGTLLIARSLPAVIAECVLYTLLAAMLAMSFLTSPEERAFATRFLRPRRATL